MTARANCTCASDCLLAVARSRQITVLAVLNCVWIRPLLMLARVLAARTPRCFFSQ